MLFLKDVIRLYAYGDVNFKASPADVVATVFREEPSDRIDHFESGRVEWDKGYLLPFYRRFQAPESSSALIEMLF